MSFEEEYRENPRHRPELFYQKFVHICPRPDQLHLMEGLLKLCPGIAQTFDGYVLEAGLSDAAREYLARHDIFYDTPDAPRDVD